MNVNSVLHMLLLQLGFRQHMNGCVTGLEEQLHDAALVAVVGGVGRVPARQRAEADPGTLLARDDGPDGTHAVLAVGAVAFLMIIIIKPKCQSCDL
jgi:hypothetical protein